MMKMESSIKIGWAISALVLLALFADGATLLFSPQTLQPAMDEVQIPAAFAPRIAFLVILSGILYAIPRTAVLGAILISGFFGGAICAHFRVGQLGSMPQLIALALAVMAWGGLYLRDARVRALLPFVKQ
jgi:hypothetical protein